jgi:DNA-binding MarR family transcriptional regulator
MTQDRPEGPHLSSGLSDVVHPRARLGILTVLAQTRTATFGYLKSILELTDGNLGRHLETLAAEQLVTITKGYEGRRPRTWVSITPEGYAALASEMRTLERLVEQFQATTGPVADT